MAYAGAEFAGKVLRALKGEKGIVSPSYVNLAADGEGGKVVKGEIGEELEYFSARVELGVRLILILSLRFGVAAFCLALWMGMIMGC